VRRECSAASLPLATSSFSATRGRTGLFFCCPAPPRPHLDKCIACDRGRPFPRRACAIVQALYSYS
jgi:hypothetical protein